MTLIARYGKSRPRGHLSFAFDKRNLTAKVNLYLRISCELTFRLKRERIFVLQYLSLPVWRENLTETR